MYTQAILTERQKKVFEFLKKYIEEKGFPPTLREIASHFGLRGPRGPQKILNTLEKKGFIKKSPGISRAIEILNPTMGSFKNVVAVPIAGRIRAGEPIIPQEEIEGFVYFDRKLVSSEDMFLLRVNGDSMLGAHIVDGDFALVNPRTEIRNGDIVVALIEDDVTLKRFFKDKKTIRLEAENPNFATIVIKKEERRIRILGKLVGIFRKY